MGFGPLETVKIYWKNPETLLGTVRANVYCMFSGSAALTFTVPAGAPLGVNRVFGRGQTTAAVGGGSFDVQ